MRTSLLAAALTLAASSAWADLRVMDTVDVVRLVDGTEVRGTVLAAGIKAVVVLVEGKQIIIQREQVERIDRGEQEPGIVKSYATEVVDGVKIVTGPGTSGEESTAAVAARRPTPARGGGAAAAASAAHDAVSRAIADNPDYGDAVAAFGGPDKVRSLLDKYSSDPTWGPQISRFRETGQIPPEIRPLLEQFLKNRPRGRVK